MTRATTASMAALAVLFVGATCASAQAPTRAEALTPPGLTLVDVRVPDHAEVPVRLLYAPAGQTRAQVWIEVLVTGSPEEARRRAAGMASRVQAGLDPRDDVGEAAWGDGGMIVFARGPVAVGVRLVGGGRDALALARHVDAALREARPTAGPAPRMHVAASRGADVPAPIRFEGDVLAAHVSVTGDGYARRTRDGWVLVRTGTGPHAVRAFAVDSALRVHRLGQGR